MSRLFTANAKIAMYVSSAFSVVISVIITLIYQLMTLLTILIFTKTTEWKEQENLHILIKSAFEKNKSYTPNIVQI